jgi:hypothetical protein
VVEKKGISISKWRREIEETIAANCYLGLGIFQRGILKFVWRVVFRRYRCSQS